MIKKITFYVFFFLMLFAIELNVFSQDKIVLEQRNSFGGLTLQDVISEEEIEKYGYKMAIIYYDSFENMVKAIFTIADHITKEKGIIEQTNYYNGGHITRYEMKYSDEFVTIHDYDKVIEIMGPGGIAHETYWYKNDNLIDVIYYPDDINNFQWFNINYLNNEFRSFYDEIIDILMPDKDNINISAKYISVRSIVKIDKNIFDLEYIDIENIKILSSQLGVPDFYKYYTKKIRVFNEDKSYWLYIQNNLEHLVNGQEATIRYYPISRNGELYLMCVGFYIITLEPNVSIIIGEPKLFHLID